MKFFDKKNIPVYLIVFNLIFLYPIGVYLLVLKITQSLRNLKLTSKILSTLGYLGLVGGLIYFFINYNVYLSLIDSHMNLDMYSFSFIYIYIFIIIFVISSFLGSNYLNNKCDKLVIYTEFVNIRRIKDIDLIKEETSEDTEEIKDNINQLIKVGALVNVKISEDKIVSTKTVEKQKNKKLVMCKSCGNIEILNKKFVYCSFCMRKIVIKTRL